MRSLRVVQGPNDYWEVTGTVCAVVVQPQVTAALVRERAVRLIPAAKLGLAPHGTTLVNIDTVMWVDASKHQTLPTVQILGHTVRITLTLAHVTWNFGDGHTDQTPTPGRAYRQHTDPCTTAQCPDYYGHTYTRPGHVHLNATATWTARFTIDGAEATTIPGTVTGPRATATITVKQARGVLVPTPGQH